MIKVKAKVRSNQPIRVYFNRSTAQHGVTQTQSVLRKTAQNAKVTTREPMVPAVRNSGLQPVRPKQPLIIEGEFREIHPQQRLSGGSQQRLMPPRDEFTAEELRAAREQLNKEREEFLLNKRKFERYELPIEIARQRRDAGLLSKNEGTSVNNPGSTFKKSVLYGTGTLAAGAGLTAGVAYGAYNLIYPEGRDNPRY